MSEKLDKKIDVKYVGKRVEQIIRWENKKYLFNRFNNYMKEIPYSCFVFLTQNYLGQFEPISYKDELNKLARRVVDLENELTEKVKSKRGKKGD